MPAKPLCPIKPIRLVQQSLARALPPLILPLLILGSQPIHAGEEQKPPSPQQEATAVRMENAIARKLLHQATQLLPHVDQAGLGSLKRKLEQFDRAVDAAKLSTGLRQRRALFAHHVRTLEVSQALTNISAIRGEIYKKAEKEAVEASRFGFVNPETWSPSSAEWEEASQERRRLFAELASQYASVPVSPAALSAELDATLADLASQSASCPIRHDGEMTLPNTHEGKQVYLDRLQGALFQAQARWHDSLSSYAESNLALAGIDDELDNVYSDRERFRYQPLTGELLVDLNHIPWMKKLSHMEWLPLFELPSLALMFGFPGVHALYSQTPADGIERHMQVPGATLGWGAYLLEALGAQDEEARCSHLRLRLLLASMAQLELLHFADRLCVDGCALDFMTETNPDYPALGYGGVLGILGPTAQATAIFAGQQKYKELRDWCRAAKGCTVARFHQLVVDTGPITFPLLEALVKRLADDG